MSTLFVIVVFHKLSSNHPFCNRNHLKCYIPEKISEHAIYEALYRIVSNGLLVNDVEQTKIDLRDKDDIPFFEVKESTDEFTSRLVTGNIRDFPEDEDIVTPQAMISIMKHLEKELERMERIWVFDKSYHDSVDMLIAQHLATPKYTSGKELIGEIFDAQSQKVKSSYFEKD